MKPTKLVVSWIRPLCQIRMEPAPASIHSREPLLEARHISRASLCTYSYLCFCANGNFSFTFLCHYPAAAMTRNQQVVYPGLGKNYMSPQRPGRHVKNQLIVAQPGQQSRRNQILKKLRELDEKANSLSSDVQDVFDAPTVDSKMDWEDEPSEYQYESTEYHHHETTDTPRRRKRRNHTTDTLNQYQAWKEIVPLLVEPLLSYIAGTTAGVTPQVVDIPQCPQCDGSKSSRVLCLFWDRE
jgi:hypothetical protein